MNERLRFFIVLSIMALSTGCQTLPPADESTSFQRGVVSRDGEAFTFRDCFFSSSQAISDPRGELKRWFRDAPQMLQQVYVELEAQPDPENPQNMLLRDLLLVGSHPRACEFELNGNQYRAAGEKPLWVADIRNEGVRIQPPGRLKRLLFPPVEPRLVGDEMIWESSLSVQGGHRMTLRLAEQACFDQYGTRYPYTATLRLNKQQYKGCARKGDLGRRVLPADYLYESDTQSVRLQLKEAGEALLIEGHREQSEFVVTHSEGRWDLLSSGRVMLEVTSEAGIKQLMFFIRNRDGSLTLNGSDTHFEKARLRFKRQ